LIYLLNNKIVELKYVKKTFHLYNGIKKMHSFYTII